MSAPSSPSPRDRRNHFRITSVLPVNIRREADSQEGALTEQSVNLSGGGISFISDHIHHPGDILIVALSLPAQVLTLRAEVLRLTPIPHRAHTSRVHARFIQMAEHDREILIRHVLHLQREHLNEHYSA